MTDAYFSREPSQAERDHWNAVAQHFTYSAGITRSEMNGSPYVELRHENARRHRAGSKNWPAHYL